MRPVVLGFKNATKILIAAICLVSVAACDYLPFGYVSVREIVTNPTYYDGREVKVRGTVSDINKIPLVDLRLYALNDQGFKIVVISKEPMPAANSTITVIGTVESFAIIANESVGLHLREQRRPGFSF